MSALEKDTPPIEYPDPGKFMLKAQLAIIKLSKSKRLFSVTSHVSQDLGISYNFAAGIVEMLEQSGWISEPNNMGERQILA